MYHAIYLRFFFPEGEKTVLTHHKNSRIKCDTLDVTVLKTHKTVYSSAVETTLTLFSCVLVQKK